MNIASLFFPPLKGFFPIKPFKSLIFSLEQAPVPFYQGVKEEQANASVIPSNAGFRKIKRDNEPKDKGIYINIIYSQFY